MLYTKLLKLFVVLSCALAPILSQARSLRAGRAAERLQHPLIMGASVSSGMLTLSPGDRAARWFTPSENITNIARAGYSSVHFMNVNPASLASFSSVIALDYMFWDSTSTDVGRSIASLHRLINSAAAAHVPLVLGDIPQLIGSQVSRGVLNQAIHASCVRSRGCYLLHFDRLHEQAVWVGIPIGDRAYSYSSLSFDGLHLNERGADYVARMIVSLLN